MPSEICDFFQGVPPMKRREFLKSAATAGAAAVLTTPERGEAASAATKPDAESLRRLYPLGPDSKSQPGVPKGSTFSFSMDGSNYFPGTTRTIDVYVPDQYAGAQPACVWVSLDRLMDSLPAVFDNLIHKKQMPVTIAIGLHPGTVASANPPQNPRFNRSFEFDSLSDVLARFILEELLPAVEKRKTARDLPIRLSRDPNDCGITGGSSGGIGAFTVAWQRPDAFRRVYTMIGTWVGMRGGDRYPVLVRKTEPKPLRIFLQDGNNDGWPGGLELGDWWMGNQEMERSLSFAGYEVNHAWGVGNHDTYQGESILPDVLRWLWKDWPKPIEAGQTSNFAVQAIAKPEEAWEKIGKHSQTATHPPSPFPKYASPPVVDANSTAAAITADRQGNLYVQNPSDGLVVRIVADRSEDAGRSQNAFARVHPGDNGLAFSADGKLYVAEIETARILAFDADRKMKVVAEGIRGHRLIATHEGNIYLTEAAAEDGSRSYSGKVWLLSPDGSKRIVADQLNGPAGIALSPDGLWLLCRGKQRTPRLQLSGRKRWEPAGWRTDLLVPRSRFLQRLRGNANLHGSPGMDLRRHAHGGAGL